MILLYLQIFKLISDKQDNNKNAYDSRKIDLIVLSNKITLVQIFKIKWNRIYILSLSSLMFKKSVYNVSTILFYGELEFNIILGGYTKGAITCSAWD